MKWRGQLSPPLTWFHMFDCDTHDPEDILPAGLASETADDRAEDGAEERGEGEEGAGGSALASRPHVGDGSS